MEKIKAKVEQVLHKDNTTTGGDSTGPHHSHAANTADPRVDSTQTAGYGNTASAGGANYSAGNTTSTGGHSTGHHTTAGGYGSDPTGPHDSRLGNKADPRVDSDRYGATGNTTSTGGYGTGHSTTGHHPTGIQGSDPTGPHDSRLANKLDPRVDSDQYGASGNTAGAGGYGTGHSTTTGHHTATGGYGSDPTGPHDSRLGNKADPRVDSDRYGAAGNTAGVGGYGTEHTTTGGHHGGHHNTAGGYGSDPTGPHDSRLGNKADPRVDSDRYGAAGNTAGVGGYGTEHSTGGHHGGHHGGHNTAGAYGNDPTGPHSSHLGNKADPRVDSDRYGTAGNTASTGGGAGAFSNPGPAANTAGPHKSDLLNKADPRVDSDLDGSKTFGGNKTQGY